MLTSAPANLPSRWHREPFRIFFPLAVLFGTLGVGHWVFYLTGVISEYSCLLHGLMQMQAFLMALALGFLLTAVPRRTQTPPPSTLELGGLGLTVLATAAGVLSEQWVIAEGAYAATFAILLMFALRRFRGRIAGRRPPAAFVLIPIGVLHGFVGAALIAAWRPADLAPWAMRLGRLMVEQGVFLCLAIGAGSLVLPLMSGTPPPADLGSSPRETRRAVGYAAIGAMLCASFLAEAAGYDRGAPLVRAAIVATALALGARITHAPTRPGVHRRFAWLAMWLMPVGLALSAALPDYRVPALHVLFMSGFSLLGFGVATHVTLAHLDEPAALLSPRPVKIVGGAVLLATVGRLTADWSHTYFEHLGWSAGIWIGGVLIWASWLTPRWLRR